LTLYAHEGVQQDRMTFNRMQAGNDADNRAIAAEAERLSIRSSIGESSYINAVADDLQLPARDAHGLRQELRD
jgi:hypothetical protein